MARSSGDATACGTHQHALRVRAPITGNAGAAARPCHTAQWEAFAAYALEAHMEYQAVVAGANATLNVRAV